MGVLRVELLGEVRVWAGDREVAAGPPRQRAVLAVLALRAGEAVSRAALIDGVWGEAAPASVAGSVHTYVHGLRRVLSAAGDDVVARSGSGYRLALEPAALDVVVAEDGARRARELAASGQRAAAADLLGETLRLWRGVPLSGVPGPLAEAERVRLTDLRFQLVERRAELLLDERRCGEAVGELVDAVRAEPFRERLRALLMLALYRDGRRADALAEFEAVRRVLGAELGLDPGQELVDLHVRMLRSDPALDVVAEPPSAGRAPAVVPAQLPHDVADFVGRTAELEQLAQWRVPAGQDARALVITALDGTGGIGKTSLAIRFARRVAHEYPDGQLYLNLRGFDPHRAPMPASEALGQLLWSLGAGGRGKDPDSQVALYRTLLSGKRMLIVLDNAVSSEQVRELLPGPSGNLVVVTSRNRLSGLVVREGARRLTLGALSEAEAVDLLRTAAGRLLVDAEPAEAAAVARMCGYLPLAVRIAAEKISSDPRVTLRERAAALAAAQERLDALDAGDDDRMSSVRSVFSWSYLSLEPEVARAFRFLGLFPGHDLGVAAAAALIGRPLDVTEHLMSVLCEQNLVERAGDRYRFHDLVRVYAAELVRDDDTAAERSAACRDLLVWYLLVARQAFAVLVPDASVPIDESETSFVLPEISSREDATAWFRAEASNVLALTEQALRAGENRLAWQLAWHMYVHYYSAGLLTEWTDLLDLALRATERLDEPEPRLRILTQCSIASSRRGRNDIAARQLRTVLDACRALGDTRSQITTLVNLSSVMREMKRHAEGVRYAEEAVRLSGDGGTPYHRAGALDALCESYVEARRPADALACGQAGLAAARAAAVHLNEANVLVNLGHAHRDLGDPAAAVENYEAALALCGRTDDRYHEGLALLGLAELRRRADRHREARVLAERAREIFLDLGGEEAAVAQAFLADLDLVGAG